MKWHVNTQQVPVEAPFSKGLLVYFFLCLGVVFTLISMPFVIIGGTIGRYYRPLFLFGRWTMKVSAWMLMGLQPWHFTKYRLRPLSSDRPVLYVSNHRSHLDVFFYLTHFTTLRVIAKSALLKVPFLGAFMWLSRQIFTGNSIESFEEALAEAKRGLLAGDQVLIFPELTRCEAGFLGTQRFQLSPFHLAREVDAIVAPLCIWGTDQAWPKGMLGIRFGANVELHSLEPMDSREFTSAKSLALEAQTRINQKLLEIQK